MNYNNSAITLTLMLGMFTFGSPSTAAIVELEGDLGTSNTLGSNALPLPIGASLVDPFSVTTATGSLTGEVRADNTGTMFRLVFTDLTYQAISEGAAQNAHSIELTTTQEYVAIPGQYTAWQELTGTTDLGVGQNAFALLFSTHEFTNSLPGISDTASGAGTGLPLSAGPITQTVNATSNVYTIRSVLIMSFDGGFATPTEIYLPTSADVSAIYIPEPGSICFILGGAGLLLRRRRLAAA